MYIHFFYEYGHWTLSVTYFFYQYHQKNVNLKLLILSLFFRLKEKLGYEPSEGQLASSMRIPRMDLRKKQIESTLAREKLAMSNVRLVMSIAKRYDNMGAQMADLIQVP